MRGVDPRHEWINSGITMPKGLGSPLSFSLLFVFMTLTKFNRLEMHSIPLGTVRDKVEQELSRVLSIVGDTAYMGLMTDICFATDLNKSKEIHTPRTWVCVSLLN